jgi:hypothetical protein
MLREEREVEARAAWRSPAAWGTRPGEREGEDERRRIVASKISSTKNAAATAE